MEEYEKIEMPGNCNEDASGKSYTIEGQFTEVHVSGPGTEDTVKEALKKPFGW